MSYVPPPGSSAAPLPPTFPPLSSSASAMYGTHPMHMPATSSHHRSNSSSSSSHQQWSQSSLGQAVSLAEQEWKKRKANEEADPPSAGGGPGSADQHGYANKDKARGGSTDGAGGVKAVASCKECRRLKIKCDRIFPCSHCVKRGLSSICPDGELVGGKGRRPVLASTAELHQRISQLEQALQDCYSTITGTKALHPLIASGSYNFEPLVDNSTKPLAFPSSARKSSASAGKADKRDSESGSEGEVGEVSSNMGLLTLGVEGTSRWHAGGGSAYLLAEDASSSGSPDGPPTPFNSHPQRSISVDVPTPLSAATDPSDSPSSFSTTGRTAVEVLVASLPSRDEASTLARTYFRYGGWMYHTVSLKLFFDVFFPHVYPVVIDAEHEVSSQKLAIVLYVLALGSLFDQNAPPQSKQSKRYFELANSALNLDKTASLDYIRALLLSSNFVMHLTSAVSSSGESSWAILGMAVRASLALGLHRDGENWSLPQEACEERRLVFWEVAAYEKLQSANLGRPSGLKEATIDTKFPTPTGSRLELYPSFKYRFVHLLERVNNAQSFVRVQSFQSVLRLDRDIRVYQKTIPPALHVASDRDSVPDGDDSEGRSFYVQKQSAKELINIALLVLHRSWFARALRDHPEEPLNSKWSQSYVAVLEASKSIIDALEAIIQLRVGVVSRYWLFFFHAFTASVSLSAAVIQAPGSSLAQAAFEVVERSLGLFERIDPATRPKDELPTLRRLRNRAAEKLRSSSTAFPSSTAPLASHSSKSSGGSLPEEIDLLGTETALHRAVSTSSATRQASTGPSPPYPLVSSPLPTTLEEAFAAQPIAQPPLPQASNPGDASFDLFSASYDPSNYYWGGGAGVGVMGAPVGPDPMMDGLAPGVGNMGGVGDGGMHVDFFGGGGGGGGSNANVGGGGGEGMGLGQVGEDFDFDAFLSSLGVVPGTAPGQT